MTELYSDSPIPIRADLIEAHRAAVNGWAAPGTWWTGAERLAMATEVRRARAAEPLPPWIRPTEVDGLVEADHVLPAAAVDAVWRLTNHPATLTASWYAEIVDRGLSPEHYVELVAVVAAVNSLEVFAVAMGVAPIGLPGPVEGKPDFRAEAEAVVSTHWVPTKPSRGANVAKALSAVPAAVDAWRRLAAAQYIPMEAMRDTEWTRGALDRRQVELVAARTSLLNECFY